LVEALTTHGIALARMGKHGGARTQFMRAIEVAETCGDLEGAGRARLSLIEELSAQTSMPELATIYQSAADRLRSSQDPSATKRLIACAGKVIDALGSAQGTGEAGATGSWEGFSLKREVLKLEREIIKRALRDAGGSVSAASQLLGFRHHQSLIASLNTRHRDLLTARSAVRKRRQHIFSKSRRTKRRAKLSRERSVAQTSILHVEDNEVVASLVQDMFPGPDWRIELCKNGDSALR